MLVVIVSGFRSWQVWRTEVLARDSIGFICLAWQLEHLPTREVLQQSEYHPGYSLLILLTSIPLRQFGVTPDSIALQMAAQLVSVVASVLLIFPMFFLGRALFNVRVAFWACLLFQFLPAPGRVLPDGLNEATYLLFAVTALGLAWLALRRRAAIWFGLCGVCGGLAYLIRPEGALIVVVTALVLVAGQSVAGWRRPWTSVLSGMAALLLCAVVIGGPLYLLSGRIILKPSGKVLESSEATPVLPENVPAARQQISEGSVSGSPLWAVWWIDERQTWPTLDWRWGTQAVLHEAIKGFYHVLWLPALFGLMWFWRRTSSEPGAWVIGLVCLGIFGLLLRLASMMGYVSDRHMLLIVLCGCFWIVAGLEVWTQWLAKFARRWVEPARAVPWGCGILVVMAIVTAIPQTVRAAALRPKRISRSGFVVGPTARTR
jgi:4-amino-4-deoxy-L-arabinose transferase-like glycosyltransferase